MLLEYLAVTSDFQRLFPMTVGRHSVKVYAVAPVPTITPCLKLDLEFIHVVFKMCTTAIM